MTAVDLLELARSVAGSAQPGEQIEAYAARTRETDIEVFRGEVESLSVAGVSGVGIRVVTDHRQGFAWAGTFDADVVAETLAEARDNASFAEPDEWSGLATAADAASVPVARLDLWREDFLSVSTDEKVRFAIDLDARVSNADPRIREVESTSYGDGLVESAIASSEGVEASVRRTVCSASSSALAEADGQTQSGFGFSLGRSFTELDADFIVSMATERVLRLLGARPLKSRRLPVVLDPLVTAQFLGVLAAAFNGESMLKGRSLFLDRVGEAVAAPFVQLGDDPTDAAMPGATMHDSEGVPCRRNALVTDGVLQGFLHNSATARRAGTRTTGSATRAGYTSTPGVGVRALSLKPGTRSFDEIVASMPDALYVQSVSGLHSGTNPISGDFSVGAEGLVVRDGALAEPVREVTVASTLPRMLLDVSEIGSDLTTLGGSTAGVTLVVSEMTMSGA
ncbi:MAG TPA: TldD/PmbA family protein [Acidimicrobiia bacterium]|nr:TldD/PmbA family protein [Acidimicrobiia bacterium]